MTVELIVGAVISIIVIAITVHAIVVEVLEHKRRIAELNAPVETVKVIRSPYWSHMTKPPTRKTPTNEPSNT